MRAFPVTGSVPIAVTRPSSESSMDEPFESEAPVALSWAPQTVELVRQPTSLVTSESQSLENWRQTPPSRERRSSASQQGPSNTPSASQSEEAVAPSSGALANATLRCATCKRDFARACTLARHKQSRAHRRNVARAGIRRHAAQTSHASDAKR